MANQITGSQVVGKVSGDISGLKKAYQDAKDETNKQTSWFKSVAGSIASTAGGFLAAAGLSMGIGTIVDGFKELIKTGFDYNVEMQHLHAQLTAITGSGGSADKLLTWIQQFGKQVPDTTENLAAAVVHLEAFGYNAEQIMPSLSNVAAAMGKDLPTAAQAFTDAGLGLWRMMGTELGISKEQLEKYGLDLKNIPGTLIPAFEKLSAAKFSTGTEDAMKTLAGQETNLTDRWQQFTGALMKPLTGLAQNGLQAFFSFLDQHQDMVNALSTGIGTDLSNAIQSAGNFLQQLGKDFSDAFNDKNGQKVKDLKQLAGDLKDKLVDLGGWLKDHLKGALEDVATAAGKFADWMSQTKQHWDDVLLFWQRWEPLILTTASAITIYLLPSIIKSGIESAIAAEKMAATFIMSIINSGKEAAIASAKFWTDPGSFVKSIGKTGDTAKDTATKVDALSISEEGAGTKAEVSSAQVGGLATAEEAVGVKAEASTAVSELATAEDAVGAQALTATGKVAGLAGAEGDAGAAATTATGAAGAGAGGAGGIGMLGFVGAMYGLMQAMDWSANAIHDWVMSLVNANQSVSDTQGNVVQYTHDMLLLRDALNSAGGSLWNLGTVMNDFNWSHLPGAGFEAPTGVGTGKPHAAGGPVSAGIAYPVGEGGVELFVPQVNGTIVPHQQTQAMLQRQGGDTYIHNYNGITTPQELRRMTTIEAQRKAALYGR